MVNVNKGIVYKHIYLISSTDMIWDIISGVDSIIEYYDAIYDDIGKGSKLV